MHQEFDQEPELDTQSSTAVIILGLFATTTLAESDLPKSQKAKGVIEKPKAKADDKAGFKRQLKKSKAKVKGKGQGKE